MAYLLDTDIIIYNLKGDELVSQWMQNNKNIPKFISVVTYGELIYGAKKSAHQEKNVATANRVAELFPLVDINKGIMEIFGELKAKHEKAGNTLDDMDLLIASTALYLNLTLVTNNTKHYTRITDLTLEQWKGNVK